MGGGVLRGPDESIKPNLLVAIVTHNSVAVMKHCLDSWSFSQDCKWANIRVTIVDNASVDATCKLINSYIKTNPDLPYQLILSQENRGWGAGNNIAIFSQDIAPDFVLLCNPDASISEMGLRRLLEVMVANAPSAGIVVPRFGDPNERLAANPEWTLWRVLIGEFRGKSSSFHKFQRNYRNRSGVFTISQGYASGALALLSYDALRMAGFFDEAIFMFHDDMDLSRRILLEGFQILGVSDVIATHAGGVGSRVAGDADAHDAVARLARESELVFTEKWYGPKAARLLALYRAYIFVPVQWSLYRLTGKRHFVLPQMRAQALDYLNLRSRRKPSQFLFAQGHRPHRK